MKQVSTYISVNLYNEFKNKCEEKDRSMSYFIKKLIIDFNMSNEMIGTPTNTNEDSK